MAVRTIWELDGRVVGGLVVDLLEGLLVVIVVERSDLWPPPRDECCTPRLFNTGSTA